VLTDGTDIAVLRRPQRPAKRLSAIHKLEADEIGVQVGTSARQPSTPVDDQLAANRYDP